MVSTPTPMQRRCQPRKPKNFGPGTRGVAPPCRPGDTVSCQAVAWPSADPGKGMQECASNRGIDGRQGHPECAYHPAQDIARPCNAECRGSLRTHPKVLRSRNDAASALQDYDLPRLVR